MAGVAQKGWKLVLSAALCTSFNAPLAGQEQVAGAKPVANSSDKASSVEAKRIARLRKIADQFEVYGQDRKALAELQEKPIFRWANPDRQTIGGAIFLWTHLGRPLATIGLWTYDDTSATDSFEVQSLAPFTLRTKRPAVANGWSTRQPGVRFTEFAEDVKPRSSNKLRLVQMRQLARKYFSARLMPNTTRQEELRLLPQPLYRYDKVPPGVVDGAMFSFAVGTDPEVLLLIEAREDKGKQSWHYAFANQTSSSTDASFRNKVVWTNAVSLGSFLLVMRR